MKPHAKPGPDHFTRVQSTEIWQEIMAAFVALLPVGDGNAAAVDIGCGPGLLCRMLAKHGWRSTGVDNHPEMVERAAELNDVRPAPRFVHASIEDLPFDREFDLAIAANLLFFLPDPAEGLAAMLRVTRPGAWIATLNPSPELTIERAHDIASERGLATLDARVLVNWAMLGELNGAEFGRVFDEDLVTAAFSSAGITDIKWHEVPEPGIAGVAIGRVSE